MAIPEYIPQYILTTENFGPKSVVTAEHWNELFNLLISQGNDSAHVLADLITALISESGAAVIGADVDSVSVKTIQGVLTAFEATLNEKIAKADKGVINGVASLDSTGKVPNAQLPVGYGMIPATEKGISFGVATLDEHALVPMLQLPIDTNVVTLTTLGWSDKVQTIAVPNVTANNIVFISAHPTTQTDYSASGVSCVAQGEGTLTFSCTQVPTTTLIANIVTVGV